MDFNILLAMEADVKELKDNFGNLPFFIARINKGKYSVLDSLHEYGYDFDAILIDLVQPRGDGLTLTEEIRWNERFRNRKPIDIYWLSEVEIDEQDENDPLSIAFRQNNVKGVFIKPIDVTKLIWIMEGNKYVTA